MATKPTKKAVPRANRAAAPPKSAAPAKKARTAKKAAAPRTVETVTLKSVFEELADAHDLPKKQGHELMAGMIEKLTTHLVNGNKIRMSGIGMLEVKDRPERTGRNPATGAAIKIAASKKIAFRAAKELKEAV
jgi:DNA-binding protein HU-beta